MSASCPTGCGRNVRSGHLMCRTCWYKVPPELRAQVNSTWRQYSHSMSREHRAAYQQAREAAIASIP